MGAKRHRKQPWIPETVWEEGGRWQRVRDRESRMGKKQNIQETRNGKLFVVNNTYVDVLD